MCSLCCPGRQWVGVAGVRVVAGGKGASEGVAPHLEELHFFPTMRGLSPPHHGSFAEDFFVSSHQSAPPVCPCSAHHPGHHGATSLSHRLSWPHTCLLLSSLSSSPRSFPPLSHWSPPSSSLHSALFLCAGYNHLPGICPAQVCIPPPFLCCGLPSLKVISASLPKNTSRVRK